MPRSLAVIFTFAASGAIHDFVASLVTGHLFVLFAPTFIVFGLLVVVEGGVGSSFVGLPVSLRVAIQSAVIAGTVGAGLVIRGHVL